MTFFPWPTAESQLTAYPFLRPELYVLPVLATVPARIC